jgi:hypothetical protein
MIQADHHERKFQGKTSRRKLQSQKGTPRAKGFAPQHRLICASFSIVFHAGGILGPLINDHRCGISPRQASFLTPFRSLSSCNYGGFDHEWT